MPVRLTLDQFIDQVNTLSADALAKLPVETLPELIPHELIRRAPPGKRAVLDQLAFSLSHFEIKEQQALEEALGTPVAQAMDMARGQDAEITIKQLRDRVEEVGPKLANWREGKVSTYSAMQALQAVRDLMGDIHAERARLARAEMVLARVLRAGAGRFAERVEAAQDRLRDVSERLDEALGDYHALQLEVVAVDVADKRRQIEQGDARKKVLLDELVELDAQLKRKAATTKWTRLIPWGSRSREEHLQTRIGELHQELLTEEWVLGESQLTRWLDVVVDVTLYVSAATQQQKLRQTRVSLFVLLGAFCEQQEAAAKQVARNPFVQIDPQKAIEFMLMSERFILNYFAKKRAEIAQWMGGAAEDRLRSLDQLEGELIQEMKRNMR